MPYLTARGHTGLRNETAWGTYNAAGATHFFPVMSNTLGLTIAQLENPSIRGLTQRFRSEGGLQTLGGTITSEVFTDTFGWLASYVCDSALTTTGPVGTLYTHVVTPENADFSAASAMRPFSAEMDIDDATNYLRFIGCNLNTLTLSVRAPDISQATCDIIARNVSKQAVTTPSYSDLPPILFSDWDLETGAADIDTAGTNFTQWEDFTLTISNSLQGVPALDNARIIRQIARTGLQTVSFSATLQFEDYDEYDQFVAESTRALRLVATKTISAAVHEIRIFLPLTKWTAAVPTLNAVGRLTAPMTADVEFNRGTSTGFNMKVINTTSAY